MQKYFLHILIVFGFIVMSVVLAGHIQLREDLKNRQDAVVMPLPETRDVSDKEVVDPPERIGNPVSVQPTPSGKLKAETFRGTLEKVDTGCFADGECYVVVDGKHVTVLMGWSQAIVGTIQGAPSIGDLEAYIGKSVEVYAQDTSDGKYTLYGSEGFYVKVLDAVKAPAKPIVGEGCKIGGCSSQLCVEEDSENTMSTCEWTESYACYQTATCEKQSSGKCGWSETKELNQCLMKAGSRVERL